VSDPALTNPDLADRPRTRTLNALLLLVVVAIVSSYLFAYAMTNALVAAEIMRPWAAGHDPRPMRMLITFGVLLAVFAVSGAIFRIVSRRQLRSLDALADAEEPFTEGLYRG
jgi:hypothetical protein